MRLQMRMAGWATSQCSDLTWMLPTSQPCLRHSPKPLHHLLTLTPSESLLSGPIRRQVYPCADCWFMHRTACSPSFSVWGGVLSPCGFFCAEVFLREGLMVKNTGHVSKFWLCPFLALWQGKFTWPENGENSNTLLPGLLWKSNETTLESTHTVSGTQ